MTLRSEQDVHDNLAIRELVESYNDAVMRFDENDWSSNWVDDARWDTGGGLIEGKQAVVSAWLQAMSAFSFVGFFASAGPIRIDGDAATGVWYQQEFLHQKDGGRIDVVGRYQDDYVKQDGRWLFAKRIYSVLNVVSHDAG